MRRTERNPDNEKQAFWGIKLLNPRDFEVFERLSARLAQYQAIRNESWKQLNTSLLPALESAYQSMDSRELWNCIAVQSSDESGQKIDLTIYWPETDKKQPLNIEKLIDGFRISIFGSYDSADNLQLRKDILTGLDSRKGLKALFDHLSSNSEDLEKLCHLLKVNSDPIRPQYDQALRNFTWINLSFDKGEEMLSFLTKNGLENLKESIVKLIGSEDCHVCNLFKAYRDSALSDSPLSIAGDYDSFGTEDAIIRILKVCKIKTADLEQHSLLETERKFKILELSRPLLENISGLPQSIAIKIKLTFLSYIFDGWKNSGMDLEINDKEFYQELYNHLSNPQLWSSRLAQGPDTDLRSQALDLLIQQGKNAIV